MSAGSCSQMQIAQCQAEDGLTDALQDRLDLCVALQGQHSKGSV